MSRALARDDLIRARVGPERHIESLLDGYEAAVRESVRYQNSDIGFWIEVGARIVLEFAGCEVGSLQSMYECVKAEEELRVATERLRQVMLHDLNLGPDTDVHELVNVLTETAETVLSFREDYDEKFVQAANCWIFATSKECGVQARLLLRDMLKEQEMEMKCDE